MSGLNSISAQLLTRCDEIWCVVIKRVNDIHNEVAMISPLLFFISFVLLVHAVSYRSGGG